MHSRDKTLCIVEDDPIMGEALRDRLELEGFAVDWHETAGSARAAISGTRYDMLICDERLPDGTGGELFETLNETVPAVPPTVFITGFGSIGRAVALLKLGAMDYVTKPFDIEDLLGKINAHCGPGEPPVEGSSRAPILGVSNAMRDLEATLHQIAAYSSHTVITGESGVGKEEVAKQLHALALPGRERPFIAVDCGAVSQALLESELFGHERGAFTGAVRSRRGVFEQADGGTLFFDEIANMPLAMQMKLLRVLQDRLVTRVGGEQRTEIDFRLVCATNRDLKPLVRSGEFREDLLSGIESVEADGRTPDAEFSPDRAQQVIRQAASRDPSQPGQFVRTRPHRSRLRGGKAGFASIDRRPGALSGRCQRRNAPPVRCRQTVVWVIATDGSRNTHAAPIGRMMRCGPR